MGQNHRFGTIKFRIQRTTPVPKAEAVRFLCKAEHFFDASVAVGGHDQHLTRQFWMTLYAQHDIVMELALLPVFDERVGANLLAQQLEE